VSSLQLAVAEAQPMILAAATLTFLSYTFGLSLQHP